MSILESVAQFAAPSRVPGSLKLSKIFLVLCSVSIFQAMDSLK